MWYQWGAQVRCHVAGHFYMNRKTSVVFDAQSSAEHTDRKHNRSTSSTTRYFTTNLHVATFLLKKKAWDEVSRKSKSKTMGFKQSSGITPLQYAEELLTERICCEDVYVELVRQENFCEGLENSISHGILEF